MKKGNLALFGLILILVSFNALAVCEDADGDGYGVVESDDCDFEGLDCNDNNPSINPGATEVANGIDDDCNGEVDDGIVLQCTDSDDDGFNTTSDHPLCPGGTCCGEIWNIDCDDSNSLINPGLEEICGDGMDNDCNQDTPDECPEGEEVTDDDNFFRGCSVLENDIYWADCDGNEVASVNEGDSVYLIFSTTRCNANSLVDYSIYENDFNDPIELLTEEYYLNIPDENLNIWAAGWIAAWLDDGTSDPDPEYYFEGILNTPDEGSFTYSSPELTVLPCPDNDPDCGQECTLGGGFVSIGGRSARRSGYVSSGEECVAQWDCSNAQWSQCNPSTGKATRDTSLCVFVGVGDDECIEASRVSLRSEKACSSNTFEQTTTSYSQNKDIEEEAFCGDGICEGVEDKQSCPKDCGEPESAFPWLLLFIIFLVLALIAGGVLYYFKVMGAGKPASKKSPFERAEDEKAVVNYVKMSRSKKVPDAQVKQLLTKSGWNDEQVNYAFKKAKEPAKKVADSAKKAQSASK